MSDDSRFEVTLDDGRIAKCWRAKGLPYKDGEFSAGLVEGIEPDEVYLCLEVDGNEPLILFLRTDEMLAILFVCAGALWSKDVIREEK